MPSACIIGNQLDTYTCQRHVPTFLRFCNSLLGPPSAAFNPFGIIKPSKYTREICKICNFTRVYLEKLTNLLVFRDING